VRLKSKANGRWSASDGENCPTGLFRRQVLRLQPVAIMRAAAPTQSGRRR